MTEKTTAPHARQLRGLRVMLDTVLFRAALNRGYTVSAFWLQGTLYNSSDRAVTRWLSVGVVRLEDVRSFLRYGG